MKPNISIVIPIYKKGDMVMRNLKHNMPFFDGYEVVLIDDASGDGLAERIKAEFPHVKLIENTTNKGFGPTVNRAVQEARGDYVILLGSDVVLKKPFSTDLTRAFSDSRLFAISFMQQERDGKNIGKNRMYFDTWIPNHSAVNNTEPGMTAWADGGASIVRKEYFMQLGGFNELFAPFYWEDNDLSYRAYSRGWHVLFDPKVYVEHHHESTISSLFHKKHVTTIAYRNQFLFTWCNITDSDLWSKHLTHLPYYLCLFSLKGDSVFLQGFLMALSKLAQIHKRRSDKMKHQKLSDKEIFRLFSSTK